MSIISCPMCYGCGLVPADFYRWQSGDTWLSSAIPTRETCRTCDGVGAVLIEGAVITKLMRGDEGAMKHYGRNAR